MPNSNLFANISLVPFKKPTNQTNSPPPKKNNHKTQTKQKKLTKGKKATNSTIQFFKKCFCARQLLMGYSVVPQEDTLKSLF